MRGLNPGVLAHDQNRYRHGAVFLHGRPANGAGAPCLPMTAPGRHRGNRMPNSSLIEQRRSIPPSDRAPRRHHNTTCSWRPSFIFPGLTFSTSDEVLGTHRRRGYSRNQVSKIRVLPPIEKRKLYPALTLTVVHAEERRAYRRIFRAAPGTFSISDRHKSNNALTTTVTMGP
jgi:hypothetical protein